MTVQVMCDQAALHSNRSDEFVKGDSGDYEDEALGYFNLFLGAINEAYFEAARKLGIPATEEVVTPENGRIDLTALSHPVARLKGVMNSDGTADVVFRQINRDLIQVNTDDGVLIRYTYFPTRLTLLTQEPDFPEEVVPSELYIFLAAARVYQSENKAKSAEPWLQQYYEKLSKIRHVGSGTARRVPVRRFR
jgi:hypothetical protein